MRRFFLIALVVLVALLFGVAWMPIVQARDALGSGHDAEAVFDTPAETSKEREAAREGDSPPPPSGTEASRRATNINQLIRRSTNRKSRGTFLRAAVTRISSPTTAHLVNDTTPTTRCCIAQRRKR